MPAPSMLRRAALALAVAFLAGGCADDATGPGRAVPVAAITVTAPVASLAVGQGTTLAATLRDAAGATLQGRAVTWSTSNAGVASVGADGAVTATGVGTARIAATSEGKRGEVELTVVPRASLVASVTLDTLSLLLATGETWQLTATARDANGTPIPGAQVTWSVTGGEAGIARVSTTGLVTALAMGTATIHAAADGKLAQARLRVAAVPAHDLVLDRFVAVDEDGNGNVKVHLLDLQATDVAPVSMLSVGYSRQAAPSPDGTRVAFVCFHGGAAICTANRDGSSLSTMGFAVIGGLRGDQPVWSPDGTRIAFRGWIPGTTNGAHNPSDVWVMNAADGSGKVRLTTGVAGVDTYDAPAWSPRQHDGSYRLAHSHVFLDATIGIYSVIETMRADGSDRRPITAGHFNDTEPTWAPQGDAIVFVRTGGEAMGDLWITGDVAGMARPLMPASIEPAGAQRTPSWSPDGGMIAFTSHHETIGADRAWRVYTVRADGTGIVRRTGDAQDAAYPAWIRRP